MRTTIERIQAEFLEMPGLRLTADQARRLCGVDAVRCQAILDALVMARFLRVTSSGMYARCVDAPLAHHRAATVAS